MPDFNEIMANLKPEQVSLDAEGRVVITDQKIAQELKKAANIPAGVEKLAGNIICTGSSPANMREILSRLQEGQR